MVGGGCGVACRYAQMQVRLHLLEGVRDAGGSASASAGAGAAGDWKLVGSDDHSQVLLEGEGRGRCEGLGNLVEALCWVGSSPALWVVCSLSAAMRRMRMMWKSRAGNGFLFFFLFVLAC